MNDVMITRMAAMVFDLVENGGVYGNDDSISYDDVCDALGLDDFEKKAVLDLIDENLQLY